MLHRVRGADLDTAASLLTRAMSDYPIFTYLVPLDTLSPNGARRTTENNAREDKLRHVLRFILGVAAVQGEVVAPSRDIEAIAVWTKSENIGLSPIPALCAGLLTLPAKVGLATTRRLLRLAKRKQTERRRILSGPYYLLDLLGVEPQVQGRGYGRLLIETKLEQIDREHAQCYLETSDEANIAYYQRYGFELVHQHWIEMVPVYCLLRSAQDSQSVARVRRSSRPAHRAFCNHVS